MIELETDIKLDEEWKLTQAANGDAPIVSNLEWLIQDIKLEALTQEGELFYDQEYGWSLLDFLQREEDELIRLEITERIKSKLEKYTFIDNETIEVIIDFYTDVLKIWIHFGLIDTYEQADLTLELNRIKVEVVE